MLQRLLSHDLPRSRWLAGLLVLLVLALALTPFIFPGVKALNVAAKVLVFVVLVASFDLLLGYTGIVSFAHTMFFGIGAYGIAVATTRMGPTWEALAVGVGCSLALSFVLALLVGRKKNTRQLWRYYWDTIEACVPPEQVLAMLRAAGFTEVRRHIEVKGMSILAEYQACKPR